MSYAGGTMSIRGKSKNSDEEDDLSEEDIMDSENEDETIMRIRRAHFAQAAAMNSRRRPTARPRRMSQKRKMEAVRNFHDFTKKLKKDTGIKIRSLAGNNVLDFSDFSSEENDTDSDGLSEEEFTVDPNAVQELSEENESYIDPETGDIVEAKRKEIDVKQASHIESPETNKPKTLSISDIIDESGLDLSKNVEITEVEESDLCPDKAPDDLLSMKEDSSSQSFDIAEKLKDMGEISVKTVNKSESEDNTPSDEKKTESDDEKKLSNSNALNVRRNIREVMDEKNLDASTLTAQRQESERLARVQEQQRIIREVQRQIAMNRQNKIHQKTLSLLQGGSSILKRSGTAQKLNLPNTVLVKLPSGEVKKTTVKQGQLEVTKVSKPTTSASALAQKLNKIDQKGDKKEVVEIVDSSSGEESSSSSSDSDDCIMLSDSEVPPSPEAEDDPANSGLHVNDAYNIPDEQGRVQINIGHPENEEDIYLAPQIARVIKPHQIGGVRFLFDNIIESVERFSTSTGFGCILAHSMGLGKTLQIVCFCDIFLRHTTSKTVLCIMPINTLQNWVAEFNMWLPLDATNSPLAAHGDVRPRNFPIYVLNDSHKTLQMRAKVVKDWTTTGGVLMIGYELYRLLSMKKDKKPRKKKKADAKVEAEKEKEKIEKADVGNDDTQGSDVTKASDEHRLDKEDTDLSKLEVDLKDEKKEDTQNDEDKKLLDEMYEALVKPGPDLVICDEGHRIKNSHSNISYALKQMRTKRRIVLTGYPLQNNLLEYWCMVDFVRPNYLGSKTEFCNMFERPIQNGQCIDSTPQDIRLMRYRAHVLHSLLVGFVQRRSHAVLQSTLPQKEEYVLLVRMTPLQRKLYDRFMNEVVRSATVPNPLKAFAICCKIWNHPDVLYNFLKKRSEVNAAIEEDLDLEEIGGVTKAGRAKNGKGPGRRPGKPRGSTKKPAATIPPNTTGPQPRPEAGKFNHSQYPPPPNGPYGPNAFRSERPAGNFPPPNYPPYQNTPPGYYPAGQGFNQEYGSNYYPQQPPYDNTNYPNQYPQNNPEQGYNQNYWGNNSYYGNSSYYNNSQYSNNQPGSNFNTPAQSGFENSQQQFPTNYNASQTASAYANNVSQNNVPYPGSSITPNNHSFSDPGSIASNTPFTANNLPSNNSSYTPNEVPSNSSMFPNNNVPPHNQSYSDNHNTSNNSPYVRSNVPSNAGYQENSAAPYPTPQTNYQAPYSSHANPPYGPYNANSGPPNQYPNNQPPQNYPNSYPSQQYPGNNPYATNSYNYNQYGNQSANYPNYGNAQDNPMPNKASIKTENNLDQNYSLNNVKHESNITQNPPTFPSYNYNQSNTLNSASQGNNEYNQFSNQNLETKPPLCSGSSGSPVTSWPIGETLKTELDRIKSEDKIEMKSESDGEVKIEDLDTKKIVKDEIKKDNIITPVTSISEDLGKKSDTLSSEKPKSCSDSEPDSKKGKKKGKGKEKQKPEKLKPKGKSKPKGRKDRKTSKDKTNDESESEQSEKEEKLNREEELALAKKAEEMTYDWATDLLKDYIAGMIENSAKMELFFYILNESIKLGDRLLLFSQSLFTLNLIEDYLERNYIPGTNRVWERNTSYFRLDGSTHALEREKLINEFNANPNVYLFLVSTRAGSLGINLVGANRVIVFDASWNPCHDTQAVCRVYRYGQKKPCFVYRFVMDCCLEKKIYDRQINKQGMADRVVDECNPDAVLSMKEITNLCFDNDEKESEPKDLLEHKDKYIDVLMQGVITLHSKLLTKEPFQHESLLVDRKEKKLSSAEKRLAQRGYELEKKAALAPKPAAAYRTVRAADGSLVQRPVASVRPMQHAARWIPADVWRRQGMTAQEMTLPLDVVIPTNSTEKTNIVLKAGQRVMVLKSPKGIYMQLESGKIIAIKTALKGLGQKGGDSKDTPLGKKVFGNRPSSTNIPGSLKNNSAITITSKGNPRLQRIQTRPMLGQKLARGMLPGQKIAEIRNRLGEMRSYSTLRPKLPTPQMRMLRPGLSSLSITKVPKEKILNNLTKIKKFEEETQVLDSDDEDDVTENKEEKSKPDKQNDKETENQKGSAPSTDNESTDKEPRDNKTEPIVLTTDEKLPSEEALEDKPTENGPDAAEHSQSKFTDDNPINLVGRGDNKINLLKNYRHHRPLSRPSTESSLSQLERTASVLNKEGGVPDFRKNLDDITQSYSPTGEEKTSGSRKKRSPQKINVESQERPANMSHSVSSLLGAKRLDSSVPSHNPRPASQSQAIVGEAQESPRGFNLSKHQSMPLNMTHSGLMTGGTTTSIETAADNPMRAAPLNPMSPPAAGYPPPGAAPDTSFGQYPGYGMGYGAYPNAPYYAGYGSGYYPPYGTPPAPFPPPSNPSNTDPFQPPNPQW